VELQQASARRELTGHVLHQQLGQVSRSGWADAVAHPKETPDCHSGGWCGVSFAGKIRSKEKLSLSFPPAILHRPSKGGIVADVDRRTELFSGVLEVSKAEVERGLELHNQLIVVDGSCEAPEIWSEEMRANARSIVEGKGDFDSILRANQVSVLEYLASDPEYKREYVDALKRTGVSSITITIDHPDLWETIAYWTSMFDRHGDIYLKYTGVDSIKRAKQEGKVAVLWYVQHEADFIGRYLDQWDKLHRIGVKFAHIAHNQRNFYGDGGEEPGDAGLSQAGIVAVAKLNELGILIDTSHTGQQTTLECAQHSADPIVSIHTACRDLYDHRHNKYDYVLKAIAEGGGVVGIYTNFISENVVGTLTDWLDHVDHAVNVMGIEHVAVGTETHTTRGEPHEIVSLHTEWYRSPIHGVSLEDDSYEAVVSSLDPETAERQRFRWEDWPNLTIGLVSRGYSDDDIEKIISGNWLRVYKDVLDKSRS
jgi:membrane dipeptidase